MFKCCFSSHLIIPILWSVYLFPSHYFLMVSFNTWSILILNVEYTFQTMTSYFGKKTILVQQLKLIACAMCCVYLLMASFKVSNRLMHTVSCIEAITQMLSFVSVIESFWEGRLCCLLYPSHHFMRLLTSTSTFI